MKENKSTKRFNPIFGDIGDIFFDQEYHKCDSNLILNTTRGLKVQILWKNIMFIMCKIIFVFFLLRYFFLLTNAALLDVLFIYKIISIFIIYFNKCIILFSLFI